MREEVWPFYSQIFLFENYDDERIPNRKQDFEIRKLHRKKMAVIIIVITIILIIELYRSKNFVTLS